ncbi:MAG: ABC transporter ATP-binding protein, partial [Bacillota bacterium]
MKLRVKDLNFRYQNPEILKNVNLELAPGSIMALIGPNGSGKSTLLRCINRILQPDSGIVYLDQISIESMKRKEIARAVGYVPQTKQVTSRITVFETVLMGRKPHISWKAGDKDLKLVSAIISDLGLEQLAHRHLDQLSGGQIQKVSLARALAQEPQILLLDEPTSNLDLKHQLEILRLIKEQARS